MRRNLYLCVLFLLCVITLSAQSLPTVVGVRFGDNYTSCKRVLDKRFNGGRDSYQYFTNKLRYDDVSFAGERFDYVDFEFQVDGNATYLYSIFFVSRFNLSSDEYAKQQRDRLYTVFCRNTNSGGAVQIKMVLNIIFLVILPIIEKMAL